MPKICFLASADGVVRPSAVGNRPPIQPREDAMPLDPRVIEDLRTIDTLVLALILAVVTLGGILMRATVQLDELRARQRAHQIAPGHPFSSIKIQMYRAKADGRNRVRVRFGDPAGFWGLNLRAMDRKRVPRLDAAQAVLMAIQQEHAQRNQLAA